MCFTKDPKGVMQLRSKPEPQHQGLTSHPLHCRKTEGGEPAQGTSELLFILLDMAEPSQTLLEDSVQVLGQDVRLLIALTALLPALWHLIHTIVSASNGPSHGGNGVCVPTK